MNFCFQYEKDTMDFKRVVELQTCFYFSKHSIICSDVKSIVLFQELKSVNSTKIWDTIGGVPLRNYTNSQIPVSLPWWFWGLFRKQFFFVIYIRRRQGTSQYKDTNLAV